MMDKQVKHGGCADCGSKEQEILSSRTVRAAKGYDSKALCDPCVDKRRDRKELVEK